MEYSFIQFLENVRRRLEEKKKLWLQSTNITNVSSNDGAQLPVHAEIDLDGEQDMIQLLSLSIPKIKLPEDQLSTMPDGDSNEVINPS